MSLPIVPRPVAPAMQRPRRRALGRDCHDVCTRTVSLTTGVRGSPDPPLPTRPMSLGQVSELVHDPSRLRLSVFAYRPSLISAVSLSMKSSGTSCAFRDCPNAPGNRSMSVAAGASGHQNRIQGLLVDQQRHLWPPEEHGPIPVPQCGRRLRDDRLDWRLHSVEQLLRCVQTEHCRSVLHRQASLRSAPDHVRAGSRERGYRCSRDEGGSFLCCCRVAQLCP